MASNVGPQYGKQVIRFAETHEFSSDEVFEFRLVWNNAGTKEVQDGASAAGSVTLAVNQYYIPSATEAPAASRLGSVAFSGTLLVEAEAANLQAVGDALLVDGVGRSASTGAAVTVNNTTPIIREQVLIGGRSMVLVSFS